MPLESFMADVWIPRNLRQCKPSHLAALAQAGIYFRIIKVLIDDEFNIESFIEQSASRSRPVVTLKRRLPEILHRHPLARLTSLGLLFINTASCYGFSLQPLIEFSQLLSRQTTPCCEVGLSLLALMWAIVPKLNQYIDWHVTKHRSDILQQRMIKSGWCPYWTANMAKDILLSYYITFRAFRAPFAGLIRLAGKTDLA